MRRLLSILSAISLLLCGAAGVMQWRSWRHAATDEDRLSWLTSAGDRMTIRSDAGRVTLFEPPVGNLDAVAQLPQFPATRPTSFVAWGEMPRRAAFEDPQFRVFNRDPGASSPTLRETVAAIQSSQVEWFVEETGQSASTGPSSRNCMFLVQIGSPAFLLSSHSSYEWGRTPPVKSSSDFGSADVAASLLPALEDPQRFVIAHMLLRDRHPPVSLWLLLQDPEGTNGVYQVDGLNVHLSEGKVLEDDVWWTIREGVPSIDPAQLPRIRDQWHRRLDVAKASAPWWAITATLALMPMVWLAAFVRRGLRQRQRPPRGLCRVCGYDLRASAGRCPECGDLKGNTAEINP